MDIQQISELAAAYSAAGLSDTWAGGFLASLSENGSLPRGRGVSIVEGLLAKGEPERWPHWDLANDALEAAARLGATEDADTLRSIAKRVREGQTISDRQVALVKRLIDSVDVPRVTRPLLAEEREWIEAVSDRVRSQSVFYWERRPGTRNRLERIFKEVRVGPYRSTEAVMESISQESWDYVTGQYANHRRDWIEAAAAVGELRDYRGDLCVIIGDRSVKYGNILVDVLIEGVPRTVSFSDLKRTARRPRRKKGESV